MEIDHVIMTPIHWSDEGDDIFESGDFSYQAKAVKMKWCNIVIASNKT